MQKKIKSCFQWFQYAALLMMLCLTLAAMGGCSSGNDYFADVIKTSYGSVKGYINNETLIWKGIPYAKPPVGNLRWTAPEDPDSWTGVREAATSCSSCSQQVSDKFWRTTPDAFTGGEDCLYLDVYRPLGNSTGLPVFVWIHGGANIMGSASLYDGSTLAKRGNMVVVVIQYRLGMFGWLTHSAFRATGTVYDQSGNFATLDQMKALSWVQNNIAAFGGDPAKVTIGGQSAGGHNVMNLMISPMSNIFSGAFAESPALSQLMPLRNQAAGDVQTNGIIDWLLVNDGTCADAAAAAAYRATMSSEAIRTYMRGKIATKIMQAAIGANAGSMPAPTAFMDGAVMPTTSWLETINAGNFKKVPLIIGTTKYEFKDLMTLYATGLKYGLGVPSGTYTWNNLYDVLNGTMTFDEVLPTAGDKFAYEQAGLLKSRRWQYDCNQIAGAIKANSSSNNVYSYYFTWDGGGDPALENFKKIFGASHAQDIAFFFGESTDLFKGYSFTAANQGGRVALQGAMMDYLCSFVKTGNPNPAGSSLLNWTQWSNTTAESKFIIFDADLSSHKISMSAAEATAAAVNTEIGTALATDPSAPSPVLAYLFYALGVLPTL